MFNQFRGFLTGEAAQRRHGELVTTRLAELVTACLGELGYLITNQVRGVNLHALNIPADLGLDELADLIHNRLEEIDDGEEIDDIYVTPEKECSMLHDLCVDLLDNINKKHPDKERGKWDCPILQQISNLIEYQ
jgi:hypothetical protein